MTSSRRRALIVDDDSSVLRLVAEWLKSAGFDVETYEQFDAAKNRLKEGAPDVIITDVRLGAFNGLQLVVYARTSNPNIVSIVMTGYEDHVLEKEAQAAGARYLVKPINARQLLDAIGAPATNAVMSLYSDKA